MSNELTTQAYNNLVAYNPKTSLVEVRLNPDKYPRIGKTNESQAFVLMKEIVVSAYMYRGQQADEEMVNFTTANLLAELTDPNNEYGTQHLSWFEIARAIKRGVLGLSKEMYGISVSSLYAAIIDYIKKEGLEAERKARELRRGEMPIAMQTAIASKSVDLANALVAKTKEAYR